MGPPDPRKTNPPDPESLAAEGLGGGDQSVERRLARMVPAKARSRQMAGYLAQVQESRLAAKLYECGGFLHFREWANHDNRVTLHRGYFCQVPLLCPVCAIRRGGKLLRTYVEKAEYLLRDHDAFMVTLTVKNGPDLWERWMHLRGGLRKLRERAKKGYGAMAAARGYVGAFEFTKGRDGWHPHLHMVWFVPKGAHVAGGAGSALSEDWHAITGDSFIVDARPLHGDLVDAFCEVLKYALKFSTLDLADNLEAFRTLRGKRLMTSGGVMHGLELPEDAKLDDDPLDGPFIEMVFRWAGARGYLLQDVHQGYEPPADESLEKDLGRTMIARKGGTGDAYECETFGPDQGDADAGHASPAAASGSLSRAGAGRGGGHRDWRVRQDA